MKLVSLAVSTVIALTFSAGLAIADMQPIPNPPEHARPMHASHHHHHHHHHHHRHGH